MSFTIKNSTKELYKSRDRYNINHDFYLYSIGTNQYIIKWYNKDVLKEIKMVSYPSDLEAITAISRMYPKLYLIIEKNKEKGIKR